MNHQNYVLIELKFVMVKTIIIKNGSGITNDWDHIFSPSFLTRIEVHDTCLASCVTQARSDFLPIRLVCTFVHSNSFFRLGYQTRLMICM